MTVSTPGHTSPPTDRHGPAPSAPRVVGLSRDEAPEVLELDRWAFGFDRDAALPHEHEVIADSLEWDRTHGVRRADGQLSGIYSVRSGRVAVPGADDVTCSGLTWVGVHPRDRRRGVLTAMMRHHLDDVAARGEPFSLLYAAEAAIYGRFGYGVATPSAVLTVPRAPGWRDVPGAADLVVDLDDPDPDRWAARLADCYERGRRLRPGWLSRSAQAWDEVLLDPRRRRNGAESLRLATVATAAGELRGYALFRRRPKWEHHGPAGTVEVGEAVTLDAAASRALWGTLADLDLTVSVRTPYLPVDDPLLHLLVDPRAARPELTDGLWVRIVDVRQALSRRRYARDVDVVLDVRDAFRPQGTGRWHLVAGPDGAARCEPTGAAAHLSLGVRELGSAYLGGTSLAALAGAGLVEVADPAVLASASAAFTSPVAPHCGWIF